MDDKNIKNVATMSFDGGLELTVSSNDLTFNSDTIVTSANIDSYITNSSANWVGNSHIVQITELPIGVWTQNYKTNVLEKLANVDGLIRQVNELHTDEYVNFKVALTNQGVELAKQVGLVNLLKLSHKHSVSFCMLYLF